MFESTANDSAFLTDCHESERESIDNARASFYIVAYLDGEYSKFHTAFLEINKIREYFEVSLNNLNSFHLFNAIRYKWLYDILLIPVGNILKNKVKD